MRLKHTQKVFILGCERSGSTWLSNIFDASGEVLFYMEPFADYANLFPSFPPRYLYLDEISEAELNRINNIFDCLLDLKYPHLYKPGASSILLQLDKLRNRLFERNRVDTLLSLNKREKTVKKPLSEVKMEVVKELRLNFKVGVLNKTFPDAKYMVSIRNPLLQINSIESWMKKGRMIDLTRTLEYFHYAISIHRRFDSFKNLYQGWEKFSLSQKLMTYWVINYDILLQDLDLFNMDYQIVKNEDLILNGLSEIGMPDLTKDSDVKKYFRRSSTDGGAIKNPINTNRNSIEYLNSQYELMEKNKWIIDAVCSKYDSRAIQLYF